jgi:ubiquinone/menaquinone biosynthesis C-methylase UbiE
MFDKRWNDWHECRTHYYPYPNEDLTFFMYREFPDRRSRVLDIGCGSGANSWFLAREGYEVTAADASDLALQRCRLRLEREGLNAEYVRCDAQHLPFRDNTFDCVVDLMCLYANSIEGVTESVAEAKRVLTPRGLLYSRMPGSVPNEAYEGKGNHIYLTEDNFLKIFRGFSQATVEVQSRRNVTDDDPWLEHIVVAVQKSE